MIIFTRYGCLVAIPDRKRFIINFISDTK
jgi:hypothetical protein